jgi:hypothetical protein
MFYWQIRELAHLAQAIEHWRELAMGAVITDLDCYAPLQRN